MSLPFLGQRKRETKIFKSLTVHPWGTGKNVEVFITFWHFFCIEVFHRKFGFFLVQHIIFGKFSVQRSKNVACSISPDAEIKLAMVSRRVWLPVGGLHGERPSKIRMKSTLVKIPCFVRLVRRHFSQSLYFLLNFVICECLPVWTNLLPTHTTVRLKSLPPTPAKLHFLYIRTILEAGFFLDLQAFYLCLLKTLGTILSELTVELLVESFFKFDDVRRYLSFSFW